MITVIHSALEATDGEMLRDVGPAIIRAQCAASPAPIARKIVCAKIMSEVKSVGPRLTVRDSLTLGRCKADLKAAQTVPEIMVVEAKAAAVYWRSWRDLGLIERKSGNLRRTWKRFANRGRARNF